MHFMVYLAHPGCRLRSYGFDRRKSRMRRRIFLSVKQSGDDEVLGDGEGIANGLLSSERTTNTASRFHIC